MRKLILSFLMAFVVLMATLGLLQVARGQTLANSGGDIVLNSENLNGNTREVTAPEGARPDGNAPNIGFIDSPTAACVQPDSFKNECFINWYYMNVDAYPNYIITMTVKMNDSGYVARYQGFFQTSMYAPYNMNPQGYKVACGNLGSGGYPE